MLQIIRLFMFVISSLLLISCATIDNEQEQKNIEPGALDLILCEEPRTQNCTKEYDPVCASLKNGETKTGSTACTSCSDPEVKGYKMGEC